MSFMSGISACVGSHRSKFFMAPLCFIGACNDAVLYWPKKMKRLVDVYVMITLMKGGSDSITMS